MSVSFNNTLSNIANCDKVVINTIQKHKNFV